jgi:CubicO group peptidase (beta-lactamase class C family)
MTAEFPVYSIAKTFLAQAILELGIPLDSHLGDHLAGLDPIYSACKIENLLNHTAGLSDYSQLPEYAQAVANKVPAWSREELLTKTLELPNNHDGFHYSNVGYLLFRMLLEQKTNLGMFQAIRELVLKPLDIQGFKEWEEESNLVPGYDPKWVYSGTFLATETAILDGYLALIQHREQTTGLKIGLTTVPYPNTGFDNPHYGFGIMCDVDTETNEPLFVGHGGGGPGFTHMILLNTMNWKIAIETSTSDFNQKDAILRLREIISR